MLPDANPSLAAAIALEGDVRLRVLADTMPQMVWVTLPDGYHDFYNKRWFDYTGLSYEQTKGEGWNSVLHPQDRERAWAVWRHALDTGEDYEIEYRIRRYDGVYHWFLGRASALRDESGAILKWFGTCTDINHQKQLSEELQQSQEQLVQLANVMPQLVWMATPDGTVVYFNDRINRYQGAYQQSDGAWNWLQIIHPDDQSRTLEVWTKAVAAGSSYEIEYRLLLADGSTRWHLGRAFPQRDGSGVISRWYGTTTDIHEQRQASEHLRISTERFQLISKATQDAIWDWNLLTNELWWNDSYKELFGYNDEEIGSSVNSWYDRIHPDDKAWVISSIHSIIEKGGANWTSEYRFLRKDGSYATVYDRGYAIRNDAGHAIRMLGSMQDISARKVVEATLAESEKRFRSLAENSPDLITRHGKDFRYLYASPLIESLTGISPEAFIGKSYYDMGIPQDLCPIFDAALQHVFDTRQPHNIEYKGNSQGQEVYIYSRLIPEFNENREIESVLVISTDVTERRKAEMSLRESEQRLSLVIEAANFGLWDFNMQTGKAILSQRMRELIGLGPEDTYSFERFIKQVYPDDRPLILGQHRRAHSEEGISPRHNIEYRLVSEGGQLRWLRSIGQPMYDATGQLERNVGVLIDITEEKEAARLIEQSELQFRTLANSIPQLAWMARPDGEIYWYNNRWSEYTGMAQGQTQGIDWAELLHPDHRTRFEEFAGMAWKAAQPWELTIPLRRVDAMFRWFLTRVYPVMDSEGTLLHWIGTHTDITKQKEVEELLEHRVKERTTELELRNQELEQFSFASHHDLQEPIRKISIFTDMVRKNAGPQLDDSSQQLLDRVTAAAQHMSLVLRDILDYSSMSRREDVKEVSLQDILAAVQNDLELLISEKGAKITVKALPRVKALAYQMHQLFYNLVSNALKFSRPGVAPEIVLSSQAATAGDLQAHIDLDQQQAYHLIHVQDNGIGFAPAMSEKIFVLFQRLHTKEAFPGTGIGLALCKKVMANHKGKIWATAEEGQGACFHILLPVDGPE